MVKTKNVHLDEFLDEVQRFVRVWFKNLLIKWIKVGMILKMADFTIIICPRVFHFSFDLFDFCFAPNGVV
jgi:hypothetical protein